MPTPDATYTLADVSIYIKRQFGDESGVQITDADIIRWTNKAQKAIVAKNPMIQASADQTVVPGQQKYSLPTGLLQLESVMYDGNILEPSSFEGIRSELGTDNNVQGVPLYWYVWANQIYLWPIPSATDPAVHTVTVNYSSQPTLVSVAGDLLGVPDAYFDRVCEYVLSEAYKLDEDWPAHTNQLQHFEDKLTEATNADKNMVGSWWVATDVEYE